MAICDPLRALCLAGVAIAGACRPAVDEPPRGLDGWFVSGPPGQFRAVADTAVVHGGRASARLEAVGRSVDGAGSLTQLVPAEPYRGKRVRFSGYVTTDGVAGWAGLWMRVDRANGRSAFDNMQDRPIRGTTPWARHAVVLDVAADASAIAIGLVQDGPGVSHVDDAALEVVDDRVAVTEIDPRPRALSNAGFEDPGDGAPRGWLLDGSGKDDVALSLDRAEPHGGAASARLVARVEHPRGETMLLQNLRADDYRGRRLRLTGWLRGREVAAARLFATVESAAAGDGSEGIGGGECAAPTGGFGWQRCDVVFDVPARGDTLVLGVAVQGRGSLWIDDIAVVEVGADVPVTGDERGDRALRNGDFEAGLAPWFIAGGARSHFEVAVDPATRHGGHASARLASVVERPLGYGVLMQVIDAADYRGRRIRVTGWLKHSAAAGDLWTRVQSADSPADGPGLVWRRTAFAGARDWRDFAFVLDVPPRGDEIQIGAGLRGAGALWLDDVRLELLDDAAAATAAAVPELDNADFEAAGDDPVGWFMSGGASDQFEAAIDRDQRAHGAASARLRARVASPTGYGTLMQRFPAGELRGKRLHMHAFVRGEAVTGRGDLWLRVQAAYSPGDGPGISGGSCALSGSFAWRPCDLVFDVPDAGDAIELGVGLAGPGTLWLDRVTLDEVSRDVPVTRQVRPAPRPSNLDFETLTLTH